MELTKTIYENRKDAPSLGVKLIVESQLVPPSDITAFYTDLSRYIEQNRNQYYNLEVQRQSIVEAQGVLLDKFPNNLYNRLLGLNKIEYNYAFLSDSTNTVFQTGKENLK